MKIYYASLILVLALLLNTGCRGKESSGRNSGNGNDNTSVPDTGFTGIKQSMSGGHIAMESTYKNGVKDGITKTYYASGRLRGTLMYENGLRVDSAKWYFEEGQLFRTTPYKRDTVDGIQKQYFRNGKLKALIGYSKGLRTFEFQEFDMEGRKVGGYPEITVNFKDDYNSKGTCTITLALSDKSTKVRYYRGEFGNGLFDSTRADKIKTVNGIGTLELKKTANVQSGNVEVLASIITFYGNSYLLPKKIELPYKDLN
jgi:hypothetical protein